MATLPAPPNAPDDAVAIAGALAARWDARPEPSAAKPPERARLPARRRGNPAALERAFERMPRDPEWLAHQDRVDRERRRLEPRGIAVVGAECRTQACRFELV